MWVLDYLLYTGIHQGGLHEKAYHLSCCLVNVRSCHAVSVQWGGILFLASRPLYARVGDGLIKKRWTAFLCSFGLCVWERAGDHSVGSETARDQEDYAEGGQAVAVLIGCEAMRSPASRRSSVIVVGLGAIVVHHH